MLRGPSRLLLTSPDRFRSSCYLGREFLSRRILDALSGRLQSLSSWLRWEYPALIDSMKRDVLSSGQRAPGALASLHRTEGGCGGYISSRQPIPGFTTLGILFASIYLRFSPYKWL
jgi:hypothetical protein